MKHSSMFISLSFLLNAVGVMGCINESVTYECHLTEDSCQAINLVLDSEICGCVELNSSLNCQITQADCENKGCGRADSRILHIQYVTRYKSSRDTCKEGCFRTRGPV